MGDYAFIIPIVSHSKTEFLCILISMKIIDFRGPTVLVVIVESLIIETLK